MFNNKSIFNKNNNIGDIIFKNKNKTLYKTSIDNLKKLNCVNWNKNRPFDQVRVDDIKSHYIKENTTIIPGIIYGWKNGNKIEIFDGIYRYIWL